VAGFATGGIRAGCTVEWKKPARRSKSWEGNAFGGWIRGKGTSCALGSVKTPLEGVFADQRAIADRNI